MASLQHSFCPLLSLEHNILLYESFTLSILYTNEKLKTCCKCVCCIRLVWHQSDIMNKYCVDILTSWTNTACPYMGIKYCITCVFSDESTSLGCDSTLSTFLCVVSLQIGCLQLPGYTMMEHKAPGFFSPLSLSLCKELRPLIEMETTNMRVQIDP